MVMECIQFRLCSSRIFELLGGAATRANRNTDDDPRTNSSEVNDGKVMEVDASKKDGADIDLDASRKRGLTGFGQNVTTPSSVKGQLLLPTPASVPASPSAKQEQKRLRSDQNANKSKTLSTTAGSQAERRQDK